MLQCLTPNQNHQGQALIILLEAVQATARRTQRTRSGSTGGSKRREGTGGRAHHQLHLILNLHQTVILMTRAAGGRAKSGAVGAEFEELEKHLCMSSIICGCQVS